MDRDLMIAFLISISPQILSVIFSDDMGFEFKALKNDGIIYPEPGMLINSTGGEWIDENKEQLKKFLDSNFFTVVKWSDITTEEIFEIFSELKQ